MRENRFEWTFLALISVQALHSIEEYRGRLWENFPPARFVSGLFAADLERGFVIVNTLLVAFGLWSFIWPVRQRWRARRTIATIWIAIELVNGVGHPLWSLAQGGYTPGLLTAPLLLLLAIALTVQRPEGSTMRRATR